jgi:putative transposase
MHVKVNGEMRYLWRAVDHEGEILENFVTKERDKAAALTFMKKALKRHGSPNAITTDGLRSYKAAMNELECRQAGGRTPGQQPGREQPPELPTTRASDAQVSTNELLPKDHQHPRHVHNHFNLERHLVDRPTYKALRSAALTEWRQLFA